MAFVCRLSLKVSDPVHRLIEFEFVQRGGPTVKLPTLSPKPFQELSLFAYPSGEGKKRDGGLLDQPGFPTRVSPHIVAPIRVYYKGLMVLVGTIPKSRNSEPGFRVEKGLEALAGFVKRTMILAVAFLCLSRGLRA